LIHHANDDAISAIPEFPCLVGTYHGQAPQPAVDLGMSCGYRQACGQRNGKHGCVDDWFTHSGPTIEKFTENMSCHDAGRSVVAKGLSDVVGRNWPAAELSYGTPGQGKTSEAVEIFQ
jgi:hypothetical protein